MAESQVARNSDALKEKTVAKCWPLLTGESRNSIQIPISFASSVALGINGCFNLDCIEKESARLDMVRIALMSAIQAQQRGDYRLPKTSLSNAVVWAAGSFLIRFSSSPSI